MMLKRLIKKIIGSNPPASAQVPLSGWVESEIRGFRWRLCADHYLDREILTKGVFEKVTTGLVDKFVKRGMYILDVGANFGYFTLPFSRLAGEEGKVWAFEPTCEYRERVLWHLENNDLPDNVVLLDYGLSAKEEELEISIGNSSASLHPIQASDTRKTEIIRLRRLDDVAAELGIERLDFIKVDIDGHEPFFLDGARETIKRTMPAMVLEFSQINLDKSGMTVLDQCRILEDLGYVLVSEETGEPFQDRLEFLMACGNFTHTANVWAYPRCLKYPNAPSILGMT